MVVILDYYIADCLFCQESLRKYFVNKRYVNSNERVPAVVFRKLAETDDATVVSIMYHRHFTYNVYAMIYANKCW